MKISVDLADGKVRGIDLVLRRGRESIAGAGRQSRPCDGHVGMGSAPGGASGALGCLVEGHSSGPESSVQVPVESPPLAGGGTPITGSGRRGSIPTFAVAGGSQQATLALDLSREGIEALEGIRNGADLQLLISLWGVARRGAEVDEFRADIQHRVHRGPWIEVLNRVG